MDVTLARVTMTRKFDTRQGTAVDDWRFNQPKVVVPVDAFCFENGIFYDGTAELVALTIDPTVPKTLRAMPGFEGKDLDGKRCLMQSYGAIYVEVRSVPDNEQLVLRPGKLLQVELSS
eukprot:SAG31_NODE_10427_length_1140_cov_0.734870_2_plen_117_part_01